MVQSDELAHAPGDSPSSDAPRPSLRRAESFPWLLILILGVGLALRLLYVTAPLVDAHRWRQVDTAAIARVFYEERFDLLRPEAIWGGPGGAVESEFPLLPALTALAYQAFGPSEAAGRIIVIVFSLGAIWFTFVLGRQLVDPAAGLAAAAALALSPGAVFYGRAFMPDSLMVCFSLAALAGFGAWARSGRTRPLIGGACALGLAILVKLPGVLVLAPIAGCVWLARGTAALRDRRLWIAVVLPLAVAALWYWHAYQIYLDTGLTFGVFGTTKTYPPDIAASEWPSAFSKWSTRELLSDWEFYNTIVSRLYFLHLTPTVFALALVGFVTWRTRDRLVVDAWLAVLLAFVLGAGWGHLGHDYYQLPLAPVLALYFGVAARAVFDPAWQSIHAPGWRRLTALGLAIGAIAALGFWHSGVIQRHFRPEAPDVRVLRAGNAIQHATGAGALMVVVDDYGVNSPMLLYFARAKGWSFDSRTVSAPTVRALEGRGARYFAATRWSHVRRAQPELHAYLQTRREVSLDDAPPDTVLFELTAAR
jgi:hypothetical protein